MFYYFCTNLETGSDYNFISERFMDIGTIIKDEQGNECIIVDLAYEKPISVEEIAEAFLY
jgi:hypothetical protein